MRDAAFLGVREREFASRPLSREIGPDTLILDRALRRAGGGDYGHVIHFSYGLHPSARYRGNCFVEDIRAVDANAIGFGRPWWEPGGWENHPDGLLLRQNLWIDGQQVLKSGQLIAPAPLVDAARRLPMHSGPPETGYYSILRGDKR